MAGRTVIKKKQTCKQTEGNEILHEQREKNEMPEFHTMQQ